MTSFQIRSSRAVGLIFLLAGSGPYDDPGSGPVANRVALGLYAFAPSDGLECHDIPTATTRTTGIPTSTTRTTGIPTSSTRTGAPVTSECPCED